MLVLLPRSHRGLFLEVDMETQRITILIGSEPVELDVGYEWTPGINGVTSGPVENCYPDEPEEFHIIYAMDDNQSVPQNLLKALEDDIIEGLQELREAA
jgi:hypothetical protein